MKEYYKWCLFSPLWLPLLIGVIALIAEGLPGGAENFLPGWLVSLGALIIISIFYGGIQYTIALCIVWTRVDFERTRSWVAGVLWLPVIFTIIQVLSFLIIFGAFFRSFDDLKMLMVLGGLDLALGYGYAAVWLVGLGIFKFVQTFRKRYAL